METVYLDRHATAPIREAFAEPFLPSHQQLSLLQNPAITPSSKRSSRPDGFEERIRRFEVTAQEKFREAIEDLPEVRLADWFTRLLENRIIPAFTQIGFDAHFARALFKMAAPGWQQMGPITNDCVWFHPALIRDIKEIRNGVISKSRRKSEDLFRPEEMWSQNLHRSVDKRITQKGLFPLFETIPTSWIILPRAYPLLEKHHARYLPGYLDFLDRETNQEFRNVLVRIIIEFAGNYTLKYLGRIFPKERATAALFNAYEALFWKNLRNPPTGFEDDLIFCHFFRWAIMFRNRCAAINHDMVKTIKRMEEEMQRVLPLMDSCPPAGRDYDDYGRLPVTLRHGCPGISAAVSYMEISGALTGSATGGRLPYAAIPAALTGLFQIIRKKYPAETPATQKSIRLFLRKLKESYSSANTHRMSTSGESSRQLRFVVPRVLGLIDQMSASLN